jgi:hypothetical protein
MITADALVAHAVGDYVLQSDWMAMKKVAPGLQGWLAVTVHVLTYTLPFLLITQSPAALAFIAGTHLLIDRTRLARYLVYAKNFMGPRRDWKPWAECSGTGYHQDRPPFMAVWLYIITDNLLHVLCNGLALRYWG